MTEQEIIELGFEKVDILHNESQNGYNYYFYQKELCDQIVLHSTDSIDVKNDSWEINCFEIPSIRIRNKEHFLQFLEIMDLITC
jgi:hypothetical protein